LVASESLFDAWLPFAIYGLFALAIPSSMIVFSFRFAHRPIHRVRNRGIPFESGVSLGPPAKQRFTVSFYLTAMLFILFDIEIVFLYPLAVILHELAWFGFLEFLVFLGILLLAYVYIWRKGALEWH
jgi:NADH:ubiquinone oxidoreductase subunit 3 (subunit A)